MTTTRRHRTALPAGYKLHQYEIESVLGQGGFAITYLAIDTHQNLKVAIKEYLPTELATRYEGSLVQPVSVEQDQTFAWGLSRFLAEAQTLAKFQHPNIVHVFADFEANNTAYMVMEYVEGQTFEEALRFRQIHGEQALLDMLFPLLDGLETIHAEGFIHRDIKPENIYLRADGTPLLIDFGSSRQAMGARTRTLTALVSSGYTPFEQYAGASKEQSKQGPWTDLYSLAATIYRAVSGKAPADALARVRSVVVDGEDILKPAVVVGEGLFSKAFLQAIDTTMELLPEKRPQNVAELRAMLPTKAGKPEHAESELETVMWDESPLPAPAEEAPMPAPAEEAPEPEPEESAAAERPRRSAAGWSIALAAVLALGFAGYFLWPQLRSLVPALQTGTSETEERAAELYEALGRESEHVIALRAQMEENEQRFASLRAQLETVKEDIMREAEGLVGARRHTEELANRVAALAHQSQEEKAAHAKRRTEEQQRLGELARQLQAEGERLTALQQRLEAATERQRESLDALERVRREIEIQRRQIEEDPAAPERLSQSGEAATLGPAEREAHAQELAARRIQGAEMESALEEIAARVAALAEERKEVESLSKEASERAKVETARRQIEADAKRARARAEAVRQEREERISALLAAAEESLSALRLTTPADDNALDQFKQVLALDADNAQAKQGLRDISNKYVELAEEAADAQSFERALAYLERAETVTPGAETIAVARKAITERRQELALAAQERRRAEAEQRAAEEKRRLEAEARGAEEKRQQEAAARAAEEKRQQEAEELAAAAEKRRLEAERLAKEEERKRAPLGGELVGIERGCFQMGSPASEEAREEDERQHRVCVEAFAIGKHEVTVAAFRGFVEATRYRTEAERSGGCFYFDRGWKQDPSKTWRDPGHVQGDAHPVVCVSWNDAQAYVEWLSGETGQRYRLPTEAEWEYAARAGTQTARPWSDAIDWQGCLHANVADAGNNWSDNFPCNDGFFTTAPVGTYQGNRHGLHDMLGNVWEWTCSRYDPRYGGAEERCADGAQDERFVIRGGSWSNWPGYTRSANRDKDAPTYRSDGLGFRLARDP